MSVRVIAGSARGRRLSVPSAAGLRPTGDRARESLFNVLAPRIGGARVLDAFAGTGAVGIEALSRGATHVVFVERAAGAARTLSENVGLCGFADRVELIRAPWKAAVRRLARRGRVFDIAFFDPPYDWTQTHELLDEVAARGLLAAGGVAIIEHRAATAPRTTGDWELRRGLTAGDTSFSFFGILDAP